MKSVGKIIKTFLFGCVVSLIGNAVGMCAYLTDYLVNHIAHGQGWIVIAYFLCMLIAIGIMIALVMYIGTLFTNSNKWATYKKNNMENNTTDEKNMMEQGTSK